MKHLKIFKTQTDFDNAKNILVKPSVSLIDVDGNVIYDIIEDIIQMNKTIYIKYSGPYDGFLQLDDLDITDGLKDEYKTNIGTFTKDNVDCIDYNDGIPGRGLLSGIFSNYADNEIEKCFKWENNKLKLYDREEKLTTIFSFDGLKRKDNGQRDYIGQIACYCDKNKQPFVLKKAQGGEGRNRFIFQI